MSEARESQPRDIAELVERIGRAGAEHAFDAGLNPAQWAALRYFGRANRFSGTVSAFAAWHGTSRGTASQTVKALVAKGLLERRPHAYDRRSFRLHPSAEGVRLLARRDPARTVVEAAGALPAPERERIARGLEAMLEHLPAQTRARRFGRCRHCRHLCRRDTRTESDWRCALAGERLAPTELAQLCVNFEPKH